MATSETIHILGGGPAGLAAAHYAAKRALPFVLYEAGAEVGGNCRTLRRGPFLFDTGAHRLHDVDAEVTREIRELLGDRLTRVAAPSQIYHDGTFIDFPLAPFDILRKLDGATLRAIIRENIALRLRRQAAPTNFREMAEQTYGHTLAKLFLLDYSEKLWGRPTEQLSTRVAGKRLQRLDLRTFLLEAVRARDSKSAHLDGSFYYPTHGIGAIFEAVESRVAPAIRRNARITRLLHDGDRITRVVLNDSEVVEAGPIINTLPLTYALTIMDPAPPRALLDLASTMAYRHLRLGVLALRRDRFSPNASIYFPDPDLPFTRIYESKNRSAAMAPPDQTSIVVEIPCSVGDAYWEMPEPELGARLRGWLEGIAGLRAEEVIDSGAYRVPFAYPILEVGFEEKGREIIDYFGRFENVHLAGRSALFQYTHIHDMFRMGREIVDRLAGEARAKGA